MRPIYFSFGLLFFVIGLIGAFLPVLPTTPFMLLAIWMFSKSSQRFHDWLYHHKVFGPPIQQWNSYGVIPRPAKILAILMMSASFSYIYFFREFDWWVYLIVAVFMLGVVAFLLSRPSRIENSSA
ncbi:MAG: YbaN family protein [Gammaproteobacteria bacterium]|nr:YbaN family protein [Gammaproteobacteria bacterium]